MRLTEIRAIVDAQAEDEGLWFRARTAPEAYLQQELRRLHEAIEAVIPRPAEVDLADCNIKTEVAAREPIQEEK
jgi:hypothetical protein